MLEAIVSWLPDGTTHNKTTLVVKQNKLSCIIFLLLIIKFPKEQSADSLVTGSSTLQIDSDSSPGSWV